MFLEYYSEFIWLNVLYRTIYRLKLHWILRGEPLRMMFTFYCLLPTAYCGEAARTGSK